jgi:hypothetical protein
MLLDEQRIPISKFGWLRVGFRRTLAGTLQGPANSNLATNSHRLFWALVAVSICVDLSLNSLQPPHHGFKGEAAIHRQAQNTAAPEGRLE